MQANYLQQDYPQQDYLQQIQTINSGTRSYILLESVMVKWEVENVYDWKCEDGKSPFNIKSS